VLVLRRLQPHCQAVAIPRHERLRVPRAPLSARTLGIATRICDGTARTLDKELVHPAGTCARGRVRGGKRGPRDGFPPRRRSNVCCHLRRRRQRREVTDTLQFCNFHFGNVILHRQRRSSKGMWARQGSPPTAPAPGSRNGDAARPPCPTGTPRRGDSAQGRPSAPDAASSSACV
jgi:hypothetical protein